jgi:hypothetical protein
LFFLLIFKAPAANSPKAAIALGSGTFLGSGVGVGIGT